MICTSLLNDVPDERLLAIVSRQDCDLVGRVATQPHVLVGGHHVLCLCQILQETKDTQPTYLCPPVPRKPAAGFLEDPSVTVENLAAGALPKRLIGVAISEKDQ